MSFSIIIIHMAITTTSVVCVPCIFKLFIVYPHSTKFFESIAHVLIDFRAIL